MGAKLLMSTAFHPQMDGAMEWANRSVGQIIWSVVKADQRDWLQKLPMNEFEINASVSEMMGMAPFEINSAYIPAMIRQVPMESWASLGVKAFAAQALQNIVAAHDAIIASCVFQQHHANARRQGEPKIEEGHLIYLSTKNLSLPKGRVAKLLPKFVGLYKVIQANPQMSNYKLELPDKLIKQQIHPVFHVGLLRPHQPNDDVMFPNRMSIDTYDFGASNDAQWLVDEISAHRWQSNKLCLQVQWNLADISLWWARSSGQVSSPDGRG
jgi:hypothetical protein